MQGVVFTCLKSTCSVPHCQWFQLNISKHPNELSLHALSTIAGSIGIAHHHFPSIEQLGCEHPEHGSPIQSNNAAVWWGHIRAYIVLISGLLVALDVLLSLPVYMDASNTLEN